MQVLPLYHWFLSTGRRCLGLAYLPDLGNGLVPCPRQCYWLVHRHASVSLEVVGGNVSGFVIQQRGKVYGVGRLTWSKKITWTVLPSMMAFKFSRKVGGLAVCLGRVLSYIGSTEHTVHQTFDLRDLFI